jgi:tetratricopeptide (TPR) repeat protein
MRRAGQVAMLLVVIGWCAPAPAAPPVDRREIEAREAYVTGRYERALELFAKLYAETLHPTYLRNIGRCYQNLHDPERAISTFRDYLRKAPALSAKERAEIDGYIAEMEVLKRKQAEEARPAPAPAPEPAHLAVRPEPTPPPIVTTPAPVPEPKPSRWWLWTGLGVVVAAGVVTAILVTRKSDAPCTMVSMCYRP